MKLKAISTDEDRVLGARVVNALDQKVGRVRKTERGYWKAYDSAGRTIAECLPTRKAAVEAIARRNGQ